MPEPELPLVIKPRDPKNPGVLQNVARFLAAAELPHSQVPEQDLRRLRLVPREPEGAPGAPPVQLLVRGAFDQAVRTPALHLLRLQVSAVLQDFLELLALVQVSEPELPLVIPPLAPQVIFQVDQENEVQTAGKLLYLDLAVLGELTSDFLESTVLLALFHIFYQLISLLNLQGCCGGRQLFQLSSVGDLPVFE